MPLLFAHLTETGFGGFYDGIVHLLITPSDVLLVLGLALLAGQQGAAGGRLLLALLPVSWWLGGSVGRIWGLDQTLGLITTLMVIGVGDVGGPGPEGSFPCAGFAGHHLWRVVWIGEWLHHAVCSLWGLA
jgi:hypothetical protein